MRAFKSASLSDLLAGEAELLDAIFGVGSYQIEVVDWFAVLLRSGDLEWNAGVDQRDGSLATDLIWHGDPSEEAGAWLWALFLDEEDVPLPRDSQGRVTLSLKNQLRSELELLARLKGGIFSSSETIREAAAFVRGYSRAYNDRYT
jgi:hypothetical protein